MTNNSENNSKEPLAIYLLLGDDEAKKSSLKSKMKESAKRFGDMTMNVDTFDLETSEISKVISACLTSPFASTKRLVIASNADKLDKTSSSELAEYCKNPSSTTILVLDSTKLSKTSKLYKAIDASNSHSIIDCTSPKPWQMNSFVEKEFASRGLKIKKDAVQLLVDKIGADTTAIENEIKKITNAHTTSDAISSSEINTLVEWRGEVKPWVLVDALSAKNSAKVFELLPKVSGTTPLGLLTLGTNRMRELLCCKFAERENARNFQEVLCRELGLSSAQSWRVKNHRPWANLYSEKELENAIENSLFVEKKMKSGTDSVTALTLWLISILDNKPELCRH